MIATATFGDIMADAGLVIAIGLIVVFSVLVLLTLIFKLFGVLMNRTEDTAEEAVATPIPAAPAATPVPAVAVGNTQPVTTTPAVQNGIPSETVVAISAAVATVAPAGKQYAVNSICKK